MIATYQLKPHELTDDFFKKLKDTFSGREVTITVEETQDETDYLLSTEANREHLLAGIEAVKQGKVTRAYTIEELEAMAK